ncbi:uncharacterized protein LOC119069810 [Bradysia coprophila]|uniref:uncharacterized protein LOC119069810 n=1 Tax=Bradysia coprophila TaxID=38358 RepID=UPI00187D9931|nr:uncharacterized protein LOC119069810 [Bradysia coprophila]XP_037029876.1 uncharacterized protein LOC119069810 [Bradysia coprophila]XP_037029881.1 uncharacterized protein LOC119069810 [Bradysia coprophila]XP_037029889.1 uncharacterized protein LOC119069810 [Bradysia coprophila]
MSTRRAQSMPPTAYDKVPKERGRCIAAVCVSWKVFTCIFSHVLLISIVVAYCFGGAYMFQHFEASNELLVKKEVGTKRFDLTERIWNMTYKDDGVLYEKNWTEAVEAELRNFENSILTLMKVQGWDGDESDQNTQWKFHGALFYSIIVITTIGYGHIAPKTPYGKISTIFYAILGIPLMLLCLSNIGDIMASSFRFIYWRVCCFVCTREPKRANRMRRQNTLRQSNRYTGKSNQSLRRSIRVSQRTADSGFDTYEPSLMHAYSDTELRYNVEDWDRDTNFNNKSSQNRNQRLGRNRNRESYRDRHTVERDKNVNRPGQINRFNDESFGTLPRSNIQRNARSQSVARDHHNQRRGQEIYSDMTLPASFGRYKSKPQGQAIRAQSLDPRARRDQPTDFDFDELPCKTPVLCNKYAIDELDNVESGKRPNLRSQSMPRQQHHHNFGVIENRFEPTRPNMLSPQQQHHLYLPEDEYEMQPVRKNKRRERAPPPSPRIMSPMGFAVNRQARLQQCDDDSMYGDDWDFSSDLPSRVRPVPIWLCVFLVVGYIIAGAFLFNSWEKWSILDSAYFCFITLTTIGFGDFVPAQGTANLSPDVSIAFCSLYLLFGIALLAMSFNLVQEEVIANVKNVARQLGILKEEEVYY